MKGKVWRFMEVPSGSWWVPAGGMWNPSAVENRGGTADAGLQRRLPRVLRPAGRLRPCLTGQRAEDVRRQPGAEASAVAALAAQLEVAAGGVDTVDDVAQTRAAPGVGSADGRVEVAA